MGSTKRSNGLWFASNLLFLHYQSQPGTPAQGGGHRCDLLRIYYFCTINHSAMGQKMQTQTVVICFEFIIFALSITALNFIFVMAFRLWFASNLLFLHYQSQLHSTYDEIVDCCDLLRIYYFCTINHSRCPTNTFTMLLWFASNLLFLHYQSQPSELKILQVASCDLLRIYYFCTINHSSDFLLEPPRVVVICFEFIIFALSITAATVQKCSGSALWFASNLLFLHYQSQLCLEHTVCGARCDLLRIYYFCTINHS